MVENKNAGFCTVVRCFINIFMENEVQRQYNIGPSLAKPVDDITAGHTAKKGSYYNKREYDKKENKKYGKGITH